VSETMARPTGEFEGEPKCPRCGGRLTPPEVDRRTLRAKQICYPCGHEVSTKVKLGPASRSWCGACKVYHPADTTTCPKCGARCLPIRELVPDRGTK
jgi:hypothetical protein